MLSRTNKHYENPAELFSKKFGSVFFIYCLVLLALSINSHAANYTSLNSDSFRILINSKSQIFIDENALSFDQIKSPLYDKQFSPVIGDSIHQGFSGGTIWIRFGITNQSGKDLNAFLELIPNTLDFEVYSDNINLIFPKAKLAAEMPRIANIAMPENSVAIIYVRVSSASTLNPDLYLTSTDQLIKKGITDSRINHFFINSFIFLALFCFIIAFAFKEKVLITYAAYNLSWVLVLLYTYHYLPLPKFINNYPSAIAMMVTANTVILVFFTYQFLNLLFQENFWRKFYIALLSLNLIILFAPIFYFSGELFFLMLSITIPTQILIIFMSVFFYLKYQSKTALILAISKFSNLIIISLIVSFNISNADRYLANDNTAFIGCLIESLIMSIALVFYCVSKNEKQNQQNLLISVTEAQSSGQQNLLSKITHELRTPLSGILGMTELLKETDLSINQKDQVNTIHNSGEALLEMIEKITTETQMEAGQLTINNEKFDLPTLLADSVAHYQSRAEEKNIELILDISENIPVFVNSDQQRLHQVILRILDFVLQLNLLSELIVKSQKKLNETKIECLFSCSGFQRNTFQNLLTNNHKSNFNNLEIASHLVQLMGGKLELNSINDLEHSISFSLPFEEIKEAVPPSTMFLLSNLQHKRLLAVDDNKTCLDIIEHQSRTWGMLINSCQTGKEALALLRSKCDLGEPIDMVITDYFMPSMNGIELAKRIQQDEKIPIKPAIIMLTGINHIPKNTITKETGIQRVIKKPVTGNNLRIILAEEFSLGQDSKLNSTQETEKPAPLTGLRILVAEDNKVNAQVITTMLKKLGAETSIAKNGQHAVEKEMCEKYNVILMDCEMPVMDGFEATRIIRKNQQKSNRDKTPIIALTAHIMEKNLERCLHAGMNAHMSKPVSINELQDLILRTLHNK